VRIRVLNASEHDFVAVIVGFRDASEDYGNLRAGDSSEYRVIPRAYRYAYVEASVEGNRFILQPIDDVGGSLLDEGSYTYVLTLSSLEDPQKFHLHLQRDGS
jgi:hypothetical protein